MNRTKLNWGIMGAGIIAVKMAEALHYNENSELAAITSKSEERAKSFAEQNNVPKACTYDEIVNDPDIDIIFVATTHNFHFENAKLALDHGKHVLVEKAFTVNTLEAEILVETARKKNLFLMEAIWVRFLPSNKYLKKIIDEKTIGEIRQANITFGRYVPPMFE